MTAASQRTMCPDPIEKWYLASCLICCVLANLAKTSFLSIAKYSAPEEGKFRHALQPDALTAHNQPGFFSIGCPLGLVELLVGKWAYDVVEVVAGPFEKEYFREGEFCDDL